MDRKFYLDDIQPHEPYDSETFGTIVEGSNTKVVVKLDCGKAFSLQGNIPNGEAKWQVGRRVAFREPKA